MSSAAIIPPSVSKSGGAILIGGLFASMQVSFYVRRYLTLMRVVQQSLRHPHSSNNPLLEILPERFCETQISRGYYLVLSFPALLPHL